MSLANLPAQVSDSDLGLTSVLCVNSFQDPILTGFFRSLTSEWGVGLRKRRTSVRRTFVRSLAVAALASRTIKAPYVTEEHQEAYTQGAGIDEIDDQVEESGVQCPSGGRCWGPSA